MIEFKQKYYGLLHILKELAVELRPLRDILPDENVQTLNRYLDFIDHEAAKNEVK